MTGQLCLPAPPVVLLLPEFCLTSLPANEPPSKPPRRKKAKPIPEPPHKFSGKIKLYWQEFEIKPDIIIEIQNAEMYACMEILHGVYHLETLSEKISNRDDFTTFYELIAAKAESYVNMVKRLKRLKVESWDWDWVD